MNPISFSKDDVVEGVRVEGMHPESDLELRGTPIDYYLVVGFTCMGIQKHGCHCMHTRDPIYCNTHLDEVEEPNPNEARDVL